MDGQRDIWVSHSVKRGSTSVPHYYYARAQRVANTDGSLLSRQGSFA